MGDSEDALPNHQHRNHDVVAIDKIANLQKQPLEVVRTSGYNALDLDQLAAVLVRILGA